MHIDALSGIDGMSALLHAFTSADKEFRLEVMMAAPADGSSGYRLLFKIGETTAAMSVRETRWLADHLINHTRGMGPLSLDLQKFGRLMLEVADEAPGPHGLH